MKIIPGWKPEAYTGSYLDCFTLISREVMWKNKNELESGFYLILTLTYGPEPPSMSWYSCKNFHECTQVCTYRLLSSRSALFPLAIKTLVSQAECQQDYSSPCPPVLTSECGSMRSLCAWILQAPWKCDCKVQ